MTIKIPGNYGFILTNCIQFEFPVSDSELLQILVKSFTHDTKKYTFDIYRCIYIYIYK